MKKLTALILALALVLCAAPMALAAEEASAEFTAGTVDSNGIFTVELTLKDVSFNAFQFTLRYDPKEMVLANSSGQESDKPAEYQENLSGGWLSEIGCEADNAKGMLGFTGFIMPGQGAKSPLNADGTATASSDGLKVFRFRFKRLSEIKAGLSLAPDLGSIGIAGMDGQVPLAVSFTLPDESKTVLTAEEVTELKEEEEEKRNNGVSLSKAQRLEGTVALQEGNEAAVVEGSRRAIYPGEGVSPYRDNGVLFMPLRFVAEQLGAKVTWHRATRSVTVENSEGLNAEIYLDKAEFTVNGRSRTAERIPMVKNDRTMVSADVLEAILSLKMTSSNGLVIFAPAGSPWLGTEEVEVELASDMNLLLSPLLAAFAGS